MKLIDLYNVFDNDTYVYIKFKEGRELYDHFENIYSHFKELFDRKVVYIFQTALDDIYIVLENTYER